MCPYHNRDQRLFLHIIDTGTASVHIKAVYAIKYASCLIGIYGAPVSSKRALGQLEAGILSQKDLSYAFKVSWRGYDGLVYPFGIVQIGLGEVFCAELKGTDGV